MVILVLPVVFTLPKKDSFAVIKSAVSVYKMLASSSEFGLVEKEPGRVDKMSSENGISKG